MKHKLFRLIFSLLLPVMAGCSGMDTIQLGQDRPEDLDSLLEQHEYARARQVTSKYPSLDTLELQTKITGKETSYEKNIYSQARELQSGNDLLSAVELLSGALLKVPHSTALRELRNAIELERLKQLQTNEREQLIARANYILGQQQLYHDQTNLKPPSLGQRWENTRNQKGAKELSEQLMWHGQQAMETDNPDLAKTCLQLSQALHKTPKVDALLANIYTEDEAHKQAATQKTNLAQKKAKRRKAQNREKKQQEQKNKTEVLLAEAQQALAKDDLQVARAAVVQIPPSAIDDSKVLAIQDNLDQAVHVRVKKLTTKGDAQYRADNVLLAVRTWTEALSLDPDNQKLRERVERANKVLARLEELKRQQHRQPRTLTLPVQPTRVGVTRASPQH
ncbi:MAG: hypothetical protein QNL87_12595 [Gammaproteobacteria bacterium]|nr:hypothetical protein [Gammaproteobacteria bacterium]